MGALGLEKVANLYFYMQNLRQELLNSTDYQDILLSNLVEKMKECTGKDFEKISLL